VKLWMLGSGSGGNAILVECDGSRLLIDCGFGTRTLANRLKAIDVAPESIEGCLLTHEHWDHIKGAPTGAKRWGWGVYATPGTSLARELRKTKVHRFVPGTTLEFPTVTVDTVSMPHDARQPVGFVVTSRSTGARAGVFHDLGRVTRGVAAACERLDLLVIESNYDDDMLRNGPYPAFLRTRIAGDFGHLSNRHAARFVRDVATRGLNHLVLAHLSENCNTEHAALTTMRSALTKSRFQGTLTAAKQDAVLGPFSPGATRAEQPVQYSLF
jgi:phosphoribosyl 1,2-cyclic phosphodiesterase